MSIIKRSNILTFAVDDISKGYRNLYPLMIDGMDLTEHWHLPRWLDFYKINYNTVSLDHATIDSWYPVGVNFWHFQHDYLRLLPPRVMELLSRRRLKLLFYYREADDPVKIRLHIDSQARSLGVDLDLILLVSGNSLADNTEGCCFFWHFETNFLFQTMNTPRVTINQKSRSRNVTCLNRIHKSWREVFVYNLLRHQTFRKHYISYGSVKYQAIQDDFELWTDQNRSHKNINRPLDIDLPDEFWRSGLPLQVDDLSAHEHNDHSILIVDHYQDSYWNVVLETMLSTDGAESGIFITEKTLKPIRNGQSFVILGCQNSLAFLKDRGYRTFDNVIDETYDTVPDVRERWFRVYELAKYFVGLDILALESLQRKCLPAIEHNQRHFDRCRREILQRLIDRLCRK